VQWSFSHLSKQKTNEYNIFQIGIFEARASQIKFNLFFYITWLVKEKNDKKSPFNGA